MADSSPGPPTRAVVLLADIPDSLPDTNISELVQEHGLTVERIQEVEEKRRLITVSGVEEGTLVLLALVASAFPLIRRNLYHLHCNQW